MYILGPIPRNWLRQFRLGVSCWHGYNEITRWNFFLVGRQNNFYWWVNSTVFNSVQVKSEQIKVMSDHKNAYL